jgi:hypothetical protein
MQQDDLSHALADLNEAPRLDPTAPTINRALNQVQQATKEQRRRVLVSVV